MPPIFDELMDVVAWSKNEEVTPFIIADVETPVLIHSGICVCVKILDKVEENVQ